MTNDGAANPTATATPAGAAAAPLMLLSGADLERAVDPVAAIDALRAAYRALAANRGDQGKSLGFQIAGGSLHVKAGLLPGARTVFAAKVNINRPGNPAERGLPTIQGVVLLADTVTGAPLAVMDSMMLTALRTAGTAALAASYGARPGARTLAIIGCGAQAGHQLAAFRACFALDELRACDLDPARADALAARSSAGGLRARAVASVAAAVDGADLIVTCTTSTRPVLTEDMVHPGAFIAAMGADNPQKCEIAPALIARARLLVDDADACAAGGDLHHALAAGVVGPDHVRADLADLAAGMTAARERPEEIVIFDSTGSGVQDVAVAAAAYRSALSTDAGTRFDIRGGG
jgi:ornithine cyclodeaminase/alanine dehydrogenase-like protein (mu-crystallin family)